MATLTGEILGPAWPSIEDGERTDRGFEHFLTLVFRPLVFAIGDGFELRLDVPARETWVVEYLDWDWTNGGAPLVVWTSAELLRELRHGQIKDSSQPAADWFPGNQVIDRTLYGVPGTDEEVGVVHRSQMQEDIGGLRPRSRWGFDWINTTVAATAELFLRMQVLRIPLAKERYWTEQDMGNALTRIEELGRRAN